MTTGSDRSSPPIPALRRRLPRLQQRQKGERPPPAERAFPRKREDHTGGGRGRDGHEGRVAAGQRVANFAPHGVQEGRFVAIDSETGKVAWTMMTDQPLIGGALATAGNLVFFGEGNG